MIECIEQEVCRLCGADDFHPVINMGQMPPANGFRDTDSDDERYFPLEVVVCGSCSLVQLKHTVSREFLFSDYPYFSADSGSSPHFESYAEMLRDRYLDDGDLVVDVGSNDGGLLACLDDDVGRLGIDPAENTAEAAEDRGITTVTEFFDGETAESVRETHGSADVLCANNVVAHIDDLHGFLTGVDELLAEDGVVVIEVPYLLDLVTETQLSTIYHEHISYFSIESLTNLLGKRDLVLTDIERLDRHGGSVRVHARRSSAADGESRQVTNLRALERSSRLNHPDTLDRFRARAERKRQTLRDLVIDLADGNRVVGYGASAKGNVLLNYCDLGPEHLEYIVDAMSAKQGTYSPGQNVPVRAPEAFRDSHPDYALVLAWNYADAIRDQETDFVDDGGDFVLPTPMADIR